jgi:signal peptidase
MKSILKAIFNVIAWIVLVFALLVTILVFTADRNNGVATLLGYMPLTVESDSMKPTFKTDDLIITKEIDDIATLQEGDVITFWTIIDGKKVKNTHRIIEIDNTDGTYSFITKGDNNSLEDSLSVYPSDIIGKWTDIKISGMGGVMSFLRTKTGFFICILIPMALFFLFELYKLIVTIIEIKRPAVAEIDEEEIKKRAIEEYLAEQEKKSAEQTEKT